MNFNDLCTMQPQLRYVYADALRRSSRNINWVVWGDIKRDFSRLVGWDAINAPKELRTCQAYETAYHAILRAYEGKSSKYFCKKKVC